eukprot:12995-Eustigmatos_ZCMA.PRE.1
MALRGGIRRGLKQIASRCMAPAAASVAQPLVVRAPQISVRLFARPFSQSADSAESKLGELLDREVSGKETARERLSCRHGCCCMSRRCTDHRGAELAAGFGGPRRVL